MELVDHRKWEDLVMVGQNGRSMCIALALYSRFHQPLPIGSVAVVQSKCDILCICEFLNLYHQDMRLHFTMPHSLPAQLYGLLLCNARIKIEVDGILFLQAPVFSSVALVQFFLDK